MQRTPATLSPVSSSAAGLRRAAALHFQVNFHVLPFKNLQNTSHFVTLFSAHGDVVVGFAIFHVVYSKKQKKKRKEKALLHGM
jgi:hypothetical protein